MAPSMAGDRFVGRHAELIEVKRLLDAARLITLTGLGGVGKSRLARQICAGLDPGSTWLAELAEVRDQEQLVTAIGAAVDHAKGPAGRHPASTGLATRHGLLVLDTCDHLIEPIAELVDGLLRAAPGIRVLITSRQQLGLPGEHIVTVGPLSEGDAVELLRARLGEHADSTTPSDLAALCAAVDDIPLAIELVAVRLRDTTAAELLRRSDDRYQLLIQDPDAAAGDERHRSLRAAVGWSHELCGPYERLLWARLSVFAGEFELRAVEQVCAGGPLPAGEVFDALTGLIDKSVLLRRDHPTGVRYRLLDTVREFGADWLLRLGDTERMRRLHRDFYRMVARGAEHEWAFRQLESYSQLRLEIDNLSLALDYSLSDPAEFRAGLDLAGSLWPLWVCCGRLREGRHYLERALSVDRAPGPERIKALWVCAWVACLQGDAPGARRAVAACREADPEGTSTAYADQWEAHADLLENDIPRAVSLIARARSRHAAEDNPLPGRLTCDLLTATILARAGRDAEALQAAGEARALCEAYGEQWLRASLEIFLAHVEYAGEESTHAADHARSALRGAAPFGDPITVALAVELIAAIGAEEGSQERAAVLLGSARGLWGTAGRPYPSTIHQRAESRLRAHLGPARIDALTAMGQGLDRDAAVKYALEEEKP
jgi:predicted ATPase